MTFFGSAMMGASAVLGITLSIAVVNVVYSYVSPTASTFTEMLMDRTGLDTELLG